MEYNHVTVSLINVFPDCRSNSTHTHQMFIVDLSRFYHNNLSHGAPISPLTCVQLTCHYPYLTCHYTHLITSPVFSSPVITLTLPVITLTSSPHLCSAHLSLRERVHHGGDICTDDREDQGPCGRQQQPEALTNKRIKVPTRV